MVETLGNLMKWNMNSEIRGRKIRGRRVNEYDYDV